MLRIDGLHPNEVRLLLSAQRATVEEVSCTLGPHGPVKLARSLSQLLEVIGDYLEAYLVSIKDSPDKDFETNSGMRIFAHYLSIIHNKYLGYLLAPDPCAFPVELLHPLKDFLIRFGGYPKEKTSFALLHSAQYNFRVACLHNPLDMITDEIKTHFQVECSRHVDEEMKNLPDTFVFITYPQAEGRNVFFQGVLFHELGHVIDWKKMISASLIDTITWEKSGDKGSIIPKTFAKWVREITADLIAARLVGPSVLFSSRLAALTFGVLDGDSPTHPSSRLRFSWILDHLERMGYVKPDSHMSSFKALFQWRNGLRRAKEEVPASAEFATVRSVLNDPNLKDKLHSTVEQVVAQPTYDAATFIANVPGIVADFEQHLPNCGENVDPITHVASVFNAAWETNFRNPMGNGAERELTVEREIICSLALKSIEGNHIQTLWRE